MSNKRTNKTFILGLAVALLLPLSFYFIARLISKDKLHLPGYYVVDSVRTTMVNGKQQPDTVFHRVADIALVNQLGEKVSLNSGSLQNRILVIDFFFIHCQRGCAKRTQNMKLLQQAFRRNPKMENSLDTVVQFLSISVDPARDTVGALRAFADQLGANHDHWWFLTGNKMDIYSFGRHQLFLPLDTATESAVDFIHPDQFVLVDKNRYIRGYYNGMDSAAIKHCADDIVLLTLEKENRPHHTH